MEIVFFFFVFTKACRGVCERECVEKGRRVLIRLKKRFYPQS